MLKRHPKNPILTADKNVSWEAGSVFNPNVLREENTFHLFYRATNDLKKSKLGGYISSVGYASSSDGVNFSKRKVPLIKPTEKYEIGLGCEDPRVTKINDTYFIFYTAVEGIDNNKKVRIALATSKDLKTVVKLGTVGPKGSTSKATVLFPEKINGKYVLLYTWEADKPISTIMIKEVGSLKEVTNPLPLSFGSNLEYFDKNFFLEPFKGSFRGPEVGAVPVKTSKGWLIIYCGTAVGKKIWTIDALLLDLHNPRKIIGIAPKPILSPQTDNELKGVINNVTFPSGTAIVKDELYVYYGSGDQGCCLATCKFDKLLTYLLKNPPTYKLMGEQVRRLELYL